MSSVGIEYCCVGAAGGRFAQSKLLYILDKCEEKQMCFSSTNESNNCQTNSSTSAAGDSINETF